MKHKVTVVVCVAAVVVVGILSVQAYNRYQHWHTAHEAQVQALQAQESQSKAALQRNFDAGVNRLEALCRKDYLAYQALTPAQKAKQQAPDCSLQFVQ